jgi:hypothetical protein
VQTTELATSTKSVITFLGEITPLDLGFIMEQGGPSQFKAGFSTLREFDSGHSCGPQFPWSVLRPKNPDFRYTIQGSRKQALFMAEFVS